MTWRNRRSHQIFGNKMMFPIINAEDWTCPCGRRREVLGEPGKRQLRCVVCEGYGGPFLTKQDRAWLASINVLLAPPGRMQELIEIARQRNLTPRPGDPPASFSRRYTGGGSGEPCYAYSMTGQLRPLKRS